MPLGENTNGGAQPLRGQMTGQGALDIARGLLQLHPETVRGVTIPIYATLGAATLSGYDTYRVPTTHDLLIESIQAHLVLLDLASEGVDDVVAGSVILDSFRDRVIMKAANCLVDLKNSDREQKIIENHSMPLSALHVLAGGRPVDFGATPQKVLAGESLRLDVRFATSTLATQINGNAQYGVMLVGKLIRVGRS